MSYYRTDLGTTIIEARGPGRLEPKLSDGALIGPGPGQRWTDELAAACGFVPVDDSAPRPPDTATDTYDRTVVMVGTVPTVTWVQRPKTQAEIDADTQQAADDAAVSALFGPSTKVPLRALRDRTTPTDNAATTQLGNDLALAVLRIIRELERMQGVDPT